MFAYCLFRERSDEKLGCLHLIPISLNTVAGAGGGSKVPRGQARPGAPRLELSQADSAGPEPHVEHQLLDTSTVASSEGLAQVGETDSGDSRVSLCLDSASCPLRAASLSSSDSSTVTSFLSTHLSGLLPQPHCIPACSFPSVSALKNALPMLERKLHDPCSPGAHVVDTQYLVEMKAGRKT